ncbi:MAG: DNA gyrase subunit A [actinobacterium acAMD-5]|nr:MAG: DNA gyrase subunit A [actinobacterium acAMD-5]
MTSTEEVSKHGRIEPVDLRGELQRSYMDYAMSVIVGRALPDVRDGLKPVHRRLLFAMFDGGYRADRGYSKCARVVGDVMGNYHPHGDGAIYDTLVRLAQEWVMRYPLVDGQGNFGSPGNDGAAAMRYTESRMTQLAMEIVRDINEDTVDFVPNYDGRTQEPVILPSRFPNLLINGSSGIAVGMATNIPPHNLREVASGIQWSLENPTASREELLNALLERIKGPDFPTKSQIIGYRGIEEAYRTGRGSVTMRAVIDVEEDSRGRAMLVISELPYQVNPDNLKLKIAELVDAGKVPGIADLRDDSSSRTGMRIVVVLKKDAVATVVKNNLYKHTQLQETFGCNMLALVDGVPRTLTIDQFISYWIAHQIEVIQRRTKYRLREAEKRAHILNGYLKALDAIDAVIKLIRASQTPEEARIGLMQLLGIDEIQATAILDLQLRRLAALERQKIIDEHAELMALITSYQAILANEDMQRKIIGEELKEIVDKFGDERRTAIVPDEGEVSMADLIAERDVVITITRDGYAKRTMTDLYRSQRRGGKGIKGAALREDDIVEHFLVTSSHDLLLFFTNKGRVYRAKGYEVPEAGRDAKGKHVANLLALTGDEQIAQVLSIKNYEDAKYLVLATKSGLVKKTALSEFDTSRSTLIAINLKEDDEVISARLIGKDEDLILVSAKGLSVRFNTNDATLRPMGRATSGVIGMRFKSDTDHLLAMDVVREGAALVTVTDGGFAKRTSLTEWPAKGRGTMGMRAMRLVEERGELVAALVCEPNDELFGIASNGIVIRTQVSEVRATGRDTMGVSFMDLKDGAVVVAVAKLLADETDEE